MWFLLILLVVGLALAIPFAMAPDARRLAMLRALSLAMVFASLLGTIADLRNVAHAIVTVPEFAAEPFPILVMGIRESLAPIALGTGSLLLWWVLIAVGLRKAPRSDVG